MLCAFIHFRAVVCAGQGKQAEVTLEIWVMELVLGRNSVQQGKSGECVQGAPAELGKGHLPLVHLGTTKLQPLREHFRPRDLPG